MHGVCRERTHIDMALGPLSVWRLHGTADEGEDDSGANKNDGLLVHDIDLLRNGSSRNAGTKDNGPGLANERISGEDVNESIGALLWGRSGCLWVI